MGGSRLTSQRGVEDGNQRGGAKHNTFTETQIKSSKNKLVIYANL